MIYNTRFQQRRVIQEMALNQDENVCSAAKSEFFFDKLTRVEISNITTVNGNNSMNK